MEQTLEISTTTTVTFPEDHNYTPKYSKIYFEHHHQQIYFQFQDSTASISPLKKEVTSWSNMAVPVPQDWAWTPSNLLVFGSGLIAGVVLVKCMRTSQCDKVSSCSYFYFIAILCCFETAPINGFQGQHLQVLISISIY